MITLIAAVPPLAFQAAVAREVAVALAEERPGVAGAAIRDTVRGLVRGRLAYFSFRDSVITGMLETFAARGGAGATLATAAS